MGLSDGEYKEFRDLNKFVISNPVKAINRSEASDIRVDIEFERQGRKVIGLRFMIEQKAQTVIPFPETEFTDVFRFAKVNIEPAMQKKYLELRKDVEIEVCIERANEYGEQQARKGKEPNYGALYRTAITEGWHSQKLEQKAKEETVEKRRKATQAIAETHAQAQAARDRDEAERVASILSEFHRLEEDMQDDIREQFRATLAIPLRKSFDKQGEAAPMVKSIFAAFFSAMQEARATAPPKPSQKKAG
jgi:plasmid replication initiation protein